MEAIGGFETSPMLAVGVSGGPDSMALIILADRWARDRGGQAWALHVDHALRPESADEAQTVAGWLAARDIPHHILHWEGAKPRTGVQAAARDARYALLAGWCRAQGCLHLLTAHHRDDQIETHLIRRRARSGPDGLAGMSAIRDLPDCRLLRPLLGIGKTRLAATLEAEQQPFLRDPSNANPAYERARLRISAPEPDCAPEIRAFGLRRIARLRALDTLLARCVALHPAGFAVIDAIVMAGVDEEIVEQLLARVVVCVGGADYPPRRERVARLRLGLSEAAPPARTLGGCRIAPWRGHFLVMRETVAAEPVSVSPGPAMLWDRRFRVKPPPHGCFTLGYLGGEPVPKVAVRTTEVPGLVRKSLPALWDARGLAAVPHLGYRRGDADDLPTISFRPANPLTQSGFTVV